MCLEKLSSMRAHQTRDRAIAELMTPLSQWRAVPALVLENLGSNWKRETILEQYLPTEAAVEEYLAQLWQMSPVHYIVLYFVLGPEEFFKGPVHIFGRKWLNLTLGEQFSIICARNCEPMVSSARSNQRYVAKDSETNILQDHARKLWRASNGDLDDWHIKEDHDYTVGGAFMRDEVSPIKDCFCLFRRLKSAPQVSGTLLSRARNRYG